MGVGTTSVQNKASSWNGACGGILGTLQHDFARMSEEWGSWFSPMFLVVTRWLVDHLAENKAET